MQTINLRNYYPEIYNRDFFLTVENKIAELLKKEKRRENAYERRMYWNNAHYSLNRGDGIEKHILIKHLPPWAIYEERLVKQELIDAIHCLPQKQRRRICAHYFLDEKVTEIASKEGVHHNKITRSIDKALCNLTNLVRYPF